MVRPTQPFSISRSVSVAIVGSRNEKNVVRCHFPQSIPGTWSDSILKFTIAHTSWQIIVLDINRFHFGTCLESAGNAAVKQFLPW
jgi:hypothetical protein